MGLTRGARPSGDVKRIPMSRAVPTLERPEGFALAQNFLSEDEEKALLARVEALDYRAVVMRGAVARRTVRGYGFKYGFENASVEPAEPLPDWLIPLRDRAAAWAGVEPSSLVQCLVSRYPPGAGIGWHRDAGVFGPTIVGISVRAPCLFYLRREIEGVMRVYKLYVPPRAAYVLGGPARSVWEHRIPPVKELRYSLTFRSLRRRP